MVKWRHTRGSENRVSCVQVAAVFESAVDGISLAWGRPPGRYFKCSAHLSVLVDAEPESLRALLGFNRVQRVREAHRGKLHSLTCHVHDGLAMSLIDVCEE